MLPQFTPWRSVRDVRCLLFTERNSMPDLGSRCVPLKVAWVTASVEKGKARTDDDTVNVKRSDLKRIMALISRLESRNAQGASA